MVSTSLGHGALVAVGLDGGQQRLHQLRRDLVSHVSDVHGGDILRVKARKNEVDMAVGNAVGSNIFNILMVLGVASAINPVALIRENIIDIVILIVFSLIVWIYAATKQRISRKEGISMVCMYLIYAGYIIWR